MPIYGKSSTPATVDDAWVQVTEEIERVVDELTGLQGFPDDVARSMREYVAARDEGLVEQCLGRPLRQSGARPEMRSRATTGYRWPWQSGSVYWTPAGVHALHGPIAAAYEALGGPRGDLGFPVSDEGDALDSVLRPWGRYQRFEGTEEHSTNEPPGVPYGASLYLRKGDQVVHATTGRIGQAFESCGGTTGPLGFPQGSSVPAVSPAGTSGRCRLFEHGAIYGSDAHGAHAVVGRLQEIYARLGAAEGRFGFPTAQAADDKDDPTQEFEGGTIADPRIDEAARGRTGRRSRSPIASSPTPTGSGATGIASCSPPWLTGGSCTAGTSVPGGVAGETSGRSGWSWIWPHPTGRGASSRSSPRRPPAG